MNLKRCGVLARTMATERIIKCRQCGKSVQRNVAIELRKGWYVCSDACVAAWQTSHAPKPVQQSPPSPMRQLTDYVQSYAPNTNWTALITYAKKLCRDSNMTIPGIAYCLWYMREIAEIVFDGDGIRLVPYYYDMSKNWYKWRQDMKRQMAGWKPDDKEQEIVKLDVERDVFV